MTISYQSLKKDRLVSIARRLGEQKTRDEFIPHLHDNIDWEDGLNKLLAPFQCEDSDEDEDDEVSLTVAKGLRDFIPCIGGVEYAPILLPLLEHLSIIYGDPFVRDTAVDSLCFIACKMKPIHLRYFFVPLLKRLATCESYTGRVSSCRLFPIAFAVLLESQKLEFSLLYGTLCQDDTPIVRRSAAAHLGKFISALESSVLKINISPLFEHLIIDDHDTVRLLAVEACSAFGKLLEHQYCLEQVLPIIDKFSKDKLPRVRYRVAHQLYELCKVVEREETRVDLVRKFARLLQDNEEEVRAEAAGVVVKLCMILSWGIVSEYIYPPVKELLHDSSQKVRWALSGIIGLALNLEKGGHLNELVTTPCCNEADMHSPVINAHIPETSARVGSNIGNAASADSYCHQHEIAVIGNNVPPPFTSFQSTGFPPEILQEVQKVGFSAPSPIQAQSWPIALQNHDIVAVAKTGSGKTLGYLLPGFVHIKRSGKNPKMGPTMLVLSPTCVSARKIQDEAEKFGQSSNISCMCLCGGVPEGPQLTRLDKGVDVVVATPGQLNRILEMGRISLSQVSYLVFDEADNMLNMEFDPGIRMIVKEIPAHCQTLVYSATWSARVRNITSELLKNPYLVNIGDTDGLVANNFIFQHVIVVYSMEKTQKLANILLSLVPPPKTIIFCSTKKMCDQLLDCIPWQFTPAAIHEDQSQEQREIVLNLFRYNSCHILVTTDGGARGLDVEDIRVVINYDFPARIEDYVHRICRTGRGCVAYTLFCDEDAKHAKDLVKILEGANQEVPPRLHYLAAGGGFAGNRNRSRSPPRR